MQRSIEITPQEMERLIQAIGAAGIPVSKITNQYELLRIRQAGISIIIYKSYKMVYEDNEETLKLIEQVLSPQQSQSKENFIYELGCDEAGKGEWYGPLVAVCIGLKVEEINKLRQIGVKDSKTISSTGIKIIADEIKNNKEIIWNKTQLNPAEYNVAISQFATEGKNLNDLRGHILKQSLVQSKKSSIEIVMRKI